MLPDISSLHSCKGCPLLSTKLHTEPAERARVAAAGRDTALGSFHWIDAIVWELQLSRVKEELEQEKSQNCRERASTTSAGCGPGNPSKGIEVGARHVDWGRERL